MIPRSRFSIDSDDIDSMPVWYVAEKSKSREQNRNEKWNKTGLFSNSSSDNGGWFSSKGGGDRDNYDDETETLVSSSRSFSYNDSSYDFSQYSLETINENAVKVKKGNNPKKIRKLKRFVSKKWKGVITNKLKTRATKKIATPTSEEFLSQSSSPLTVSVSMFQRIMPCGMVGKVQDTFAVVKKSKGSLQGFQGVHVGDDLGETDISSEGFGAAVTEFPLAEFTTPSQNYCGSFHKDLGGPVWEIPRLKLNLKPRGCVKPLHNTRAVSYNLDMAKASTSLFSKRNPFLPLVESI
ncbi:hypothetical protein RJ641_032322 [Dillenia turbinata]|uniref:Uncharacterized protein n=1 Tax=Dillenia turbinata TaxID=194707 RepID=A0AAN8VRN9_9MAGN